MPKRDAPSSGRQDATPATTPAARLRRIDAILRDPDLTRAEADAVVGLVLHANGDGLAWPGQRRLCREFHLSASTVGTALEKAVGVHLAEAGLGPRGVRRYRVLAVPKDPLDDTPSATAVVALKDAPALQAEPASATDSVSSATGTSFQRYKSVYRNHKDEPKNEPKEGNQVHPLPPGATLRRPNGTITADSHGETAGIQGNGHGTATDPDEALRLALGREPTGKELVTFRQAVSEAQAAGATDALIAHYVRLAAPGEAVWLAANEARDEARRLLESWRKQDFGERRDTVGAILGDVRHAADYLRQPDLPSWDSGANRNRKVLGWAKREASALQAAGIARPKKAGAGKDDHGHESENVGL